MGKGRVEAFSDGVIAVIITIMVQEMKVPHGDELSALGPLPVAAYGVVLLMSGAMYAVAIPMAFVNVWISGAIYVAVALMWFIHDARIEGAIH